MISLRITAAIYWIAIAVFIAGVTLLVVAETANVDALERPGEVMLVAAWGIAAIGAALDLTLHRRHPPAD